MDTFRKEIQSLLEMNAVYLDNLESAPCSEMLPITSADTKIKQTNKAFNLPQTMLFHLRDAFKRKEGIIKRRKWSKLCPGAAIPLLAYPQHTNWGV